MTTVRYIIFDKVYSNLEDFKNDFIFLSKEEKQKVLNSNIILIDNETKKTKEIFNMNMPIWTMLEIYASIKENRIKNSLYTHKTVNPSLIYDIKNNLYGSKLLDINIFYEKFIPLEDIKKSIHHIEGKLELNLFPFFTKESKKSLTSDQLKEIIDSSFLERFKQYKKYSPESSQHLIDCLEGYKYHVLYVNKSYSLNDLLTACFKWLENNLHFSLESDIQLSDLLWVRNTIIPTRI